MNGTILSHFYNEEYLLPYWLKHHRNYFDHGIMIDYASTDNSVDIIKTLCPNWRVVSSKNLHFEATSVDKEVYEYEKEITGYRICLNTTEFLLGNFNILKENKNEHQLIIPVNYMVDMPDTAFTDIKEDILKERTFGIPHKKNPNIRACRSMHNYNVDYLNTSGVGRHFSNPNTNDFMIFYYGFCPMNENIIKRKLQMSLKFPPKPNVLSNVKHILNDLISRMDESYQKESEDLKHLIESFN